jgi:hypothetical protein
LLRGDWENASRSDLLLFRKAIREGWPVPAERRGPLIAAALSPLSRKDTPIRHLLAVCWLAITAHAETLKLKRAGPAPLPPPDGPPAPGEGRAAS